MKRDRQRQIGNDIQRQISNGKQRQVYTKADEETD